MNFSPKIAQGLGIYKDEELTSFNDIEPSKRTDWDVRMRFFVLDYMTDFDIKRTCKKIQNKTSSSMVYSQKTRS